MATSTTVYHLHKMKSNHQQLAIYFWKNASSRILGLFRFLSVWLSHLRFGKLVNENWVNTSYFGMTIQNFVMAAKSWNVEVFSLI